ncbi:MAG: TetR/AcrR family transcriptional regulator [Clostridiales bacterium]|jgi:AcrR family transcriptional regulator|nr:TetR/AcrR family transcriptional regulator [Clostridiales bacterium]
MNVINNQRSRKTKEQLRNALLQLLEQNISVDDISVSKLCNTAGLNRSTFYSHYSVINDILVEIREGVLENLAAFVANIQYEDYSSLGVLLSYIRNNDNIFRVLFLNATDEEFENRFINTGYVSLAREGHRFWNKQYIKYFNTYLLNGTKFIFKEWIKNNYDISIDELQQLIIILNLSNLDSVPTINSMGKTPKSS